VACATCTLPWGGSIIHNASVTAYLASTVASPATCTSQSRSCSNGVLSGSYANASCVVSQAGSCSATPGACAVGSVSGDNGNGACGGTRSWTCTGVNGGTNASCSVANAACVSCTWVNAGAGSY
jgi:hypothetical protein